MKLSKFNFKCYFCKINILYLPEDKIKWIYVNDSLEMCCKKCFIKHRKKFKKSIILYGDKIPLIETNKNN